MNQILKLKSIILVFSIAIAFSACDDGSGRNSNNIDPAILYSIGETGPSGVGIVFYVTDGGLHGLEVAPSDQANSLWIEGDSTQTTFNGNTASAIGTGRANSDYIIAQTGHTGSAAKICRDYRKDNEGDWFLPSIDELSAIWDNLVDNGAGANSGIGDFANDYYWSSSEKSFDDAEIIYFYVGSPGDLGKNNTNHVRAVRSF